MSRFVDPRPTEKNDESELLELAAAYNAQQRLKSVKWFVYHGTKMPTEVDSIYTATQRESRVAQRNHELRIKDKRRTTAAGEEIVIVATDKHPLYSEVAITPEFSVSPAHGLSGRTRMFEAVEQLCRIVMLRNRVELRLGALSQRNRKAPEDSSSTNWVTLIDFPQLYSGDVAIGLSLQHRIEPSTAMVEQYKVKELRTSFDFKNKCYRQLKFVDHQYANADLPMPVSTMFAGAEEVPADASTDTLVPRIEHFVQPLITLETFVCPAFSFTSPDPWRRTVQSQSLQRSCSDNFRVRHQTCNYGRLGASAVCQSDPIMFELVQGAPPRPIDGPRCDDCLSDSDDDDSLQYQLPEDLAGIRRWLPEPSSVRRSEPNSSTRHVCSNDAISTRLNLLGSQQDAFVFEMPLDQQLRL